MQLHGLDGRKPDIEMPTEVAKHVAHQRNGQEKVISYDYYGAAMMLQLCNEEDWKAWTEETSVFFKIVRTGKNE